MNGFALSEVGFEVPGGAWTAGFLGLAFVVLVVMEVRRTSEQKSTRWISSTLRVLTALGGWLVAVQPVWSVPDLQSQEGRVVVLVDGSLSMSLEHDGESRGALVQDYLDRWAESSAELVVFDGAVADHEWSDPVRFDGGDSRLFGALAELAQDDSIGAVLVLTDGADPSDAPAENGSGPRILTVPVGPAEVVDDAIVSLEADPVGFLRQPALVRIRIRRADHSAGLGASSQIRVRLTAYDANSPNGDGDLVQQQTVTLENGEAETTLSFVPGRLGRLVYRVSIPVRAGDEAPDNNRRDFLVRVTRDRLRVLLVAGRPTWDVRFLRAFLERDGSIDLISFFILRSSADMAQADPDEMALIPFPTDELFREHLGSFDIILFQDFDFGPYNMAMYLSGIARYVERGGSFAMIGGQGSFGAGGYAATPIASILPFVFRDVTRVAQGVREQAFSPRLADPSGFHPLVRLVDEETENTRMWSGLATLAGVNRVEHAKDDAQVLMLHPQDGMPVLAVREAGQGRVMALTADSSWRWGMTSAAETGDDSVYRRFWDRTLRWLARDPALEPSRLDSVERVSRGGQVAITGVIRDSQYRSLPASESTRLSLLDSQGRVLQHTMVHRDAHDRVVWDFDAPRLAGIYRVVAGPEGGDAIADVPFVVEGGGQELADIRVRRDRLQTLADASGGEMFELTDAPEPDAIDASRTQIRGLVRMAPFAHPIALMTLLLLLGGSWWWRRRNGLR